MEAEEARFRVPEVPEEDAGGELDINAILTSSEVPSLSLSRARALSFHVYVLRACIHLHVYPHTGGGLHRRDRQWHLKCECGRQRPGRWA